MNAMNQHELLNSWEVRLHKYVYICTSYALCVYIYIYTHILKLSFFCALFFLMNLPTLTVVLLPKPPTSLVSFTAATRSPVVVSPHENGRACLAPKGQWLFPVPSSGLEKSSPP